MTLLSNGLANALPYRFTFADAAARAAASGLVSADLNALALQLDDGSLWRLTATTPTWQAVGGTFTNPMTTAGDLILAGSGGTPGRLAKGADSTILTIDPSTHLPVWAAPGGGGGGRVLRLNYRAASDVTAIGGDAVATDPSWTDIGANQSFTIGDGASVVQIAIGGLVFAGHTSGTPNIGARLVIDSGGTPITRTIAGNIAPSAGNTNTLAGAQPVELSGLLAAGSHTVKLQLTASGTCTAFCRPSTVPNRESLYISVVEYLP